MVCFVSLSHTHSLSPSLPLPSPPEVCSENSSEDNLESLSSNLPTKEFVIPQGKMASEVTISAFYFSSLDILLSLPPSPPPLTSFQMSPLTSKATVTGW